MNTKKSTELKLIEKFNAIESEFNKKLMFVEEQSGYSVNLSDIDDLFEYDWEFCKELENKINSVFKEFESEIEEFEIYEVDFQGSLSDIVDNVLSDREESTEYQEMPESFITKKLEIELVEVIQKYSNINTYEELENLVFDNEMDCRHILSELQSISQYFKNEYGKDKIEDIYLSDFIDDNLIVELWDNYIDDETAFDEFVEEQKNKRIIDIEGTHYHGTFWKIEDTMDDDEIDEATYTQLDTQYSNLNCIYITDVEADAEFFNTYNQEREDRENPLVIPIVFKTNVNINNVFNIEPLSTTLYYQNNEYSVQGDREEYFEDLSPNYRGINIDNHYENGGRDIAIFDESDVNNGIEGIKIKINDEWTDYLPPEEAKELYINYCKQIISSKLDNDIGKFAKKDTTNRIKPRRQSI